MKLNKIILLHSPLYWIVSHGGKLNSTALGFACIKQLHLKLSSAIQGPVNELLL